MLDIFIEGELIDLAIPTEDFASGDVWYKWFNDHAITKYLEQGVYPNTRQLQIDFFKSINQDRLALIVQNKNGKPLGIVSLSFINHMKRSCSFAIVIDSAADLRVAGFGALEASALIIQHGFDMLGVQRIRAGQHVDLINWQQRLELIGFRFEGYHRRNFVKGDKVGDLVEIAVLYEDYKRLKKIRRGKLWDSLKNMKKRVKNLPSRSIRIKYDEEFSNEIESYYDQINLL